LLVKNNIIQHDESKFKGMFLFIVIEK